MKAQIMAGLGVVIGTLFLTGPARAAGSVDVIVPVYHGINGVGTASTEVGGFRVFIQSTATGGPTNPWDVQVTKLPGYGTDRAALNQLAFSFLETSNPASFVLSNKAQSSGGTVNGAWTLQNGTGDQSAGEVRFDAGTGYFKTGFKNANYVKYLDFGNAFSGAVNLNPDAPINYIKIRVSGISDDLDNGHFGLGAASGLTGPVAVTPEPTALALLIPGLAPLALVLRRRRSSRATA